jgi:transposase
LTQTINGLEKRIAEHVRIHARHLLAIPGCAELTAAKIIAETANVGRFKSEAAYARYVGVAPVPYWSGSTHGHMRFTRSGNRQLNKAIHRIAVTQIRLDGPGRRYFDKRREVGDSSAAALRSLKRRITRVVFSRLHADEAGRHNRAQLESASAGSPNQK